MLKKSIITAAIFTAITALPSQAGIVFNFDYSGNTADVGFLDSSEGIARQSALDTAGSMFSDLFGSYFSDSATLDIAVTSTDDSTSDTLASAGSSIVSSCPITGGCVITEVVKTKLQTGVDANGTESDGSVDVNWASDWQLDPNTPADSTSEFDFFAAIFHELTHALGFSSLIDESGVGFFIDEWSTFDTFLVDANGVNVVTDTFFIDQAAWDDASVSANGTGLYFGGANAVAANGGNAVEIYSPTSWEEGSSGSHIDGTAFPTDMMKYDRGYGAETRTYSAVDVGILTDIGYTRVATTSVPETGTLGLSFLGMAGLFLSRRKKA
ncbi:hypothetical protein WNY51_15130 [Pseudocolwellia sp. AS88]|uniref:hypothetical protein n=1 Tax=Pseudocolwellia sp. AS88 TaxID=3063958 RepID=UPI0026F00A32|nr:hypothetical protein [Pseudocolwellia sp. AS88]MDO7083606.1 hypothetical protein [Pseudocolwellia sp. AS88]